MIEIRDLHKIYRTHNGDVHALQGLSLSIPKGSIYGIVGFSGAGKSTLLRCINRLEEADSGSIEVEGRDVLKLGSVELGEFRRSTGMIFQHFNLFESRTVARNISYPLEIAGWSKADIDARVNELADVVGLSDKLKTYPGQLSGGQKQRVGIARAVASRPKILLCDEATSALDPETTRSTLHLLKDLNRIYGLSLILVTHELDIVKSFCERMAVLDNGTIVEEGPVHAIFSNPRSLTAKRFVGIFQGLSDGTLFETGAGL